MAQPKRKTKPNLDKRCAILDSALKLFARFGFHGTAVPLIADQAGVAAGTIYNYFPSKEALVNSLYREWKGKLLVDLEAGFPMSGTPREQFHHLWTALNEFHQRSGEAFSFLEMHFHAPYLDAESLALEQRVLGFARGFFEAAKASGQIKPLPADVGIALVFGAFIELIKQQDHGRIHNDAATQAQAEACLWDALRLNANT